MRKWLKVFFQNSAGSPFSLNGSATEVQPTQDIEPKTPQPADKNQGTSNAPEGVQGCDDPELKMQSARCDLHPLYLFRAVFIEMASVETSKVKAQRCTNTICNRHYSAELGYFHFSAGEPPDMGKVELKPKCDLNHERRYMVVTKINGLFLWACPEAGCLNTLPYVESSES